MHRDQDISIFIYVRNLKYFEYLNFTRLALEMPRYLKTSKCDAMVWLKVTAFYYSCVVMLMVVVIVYKDLFT